MHNAWQKLMAKCSRSPEGKEEFERTQVEWMKDWDREAQSYMKSHHLNKAQAYAQALKYRAEAILRYLKTENIYTLDAKTREVKRVAREKSRIMKKENLSRLLLMIPTLKWDPVSKLSKAIM